MASDAARVGVAVSGGADSVALLHLLVRIGSFSIVVLHLNHQLRGEESEADAKFVADLAAELNLQCVMERAELGDGNLEQVGRMARLEFFSRCMRDLNLDCVATGHTRSDQAETALFRILRGTGTAGLAAILPVTREGLIRPLLDVSREEVRAFLSEQGIAWREDSSNADMHFARNRIRLLMPELARDFNPRVEESLARLADISRQEEGFWSTEVAALEAIVSSGDSVLVSLKKIASAHPALARRVFRRAIGLSKGDLRRINLEHVEQVVQLAVEPEGGGRLVLPGGVQVCRSFDQLRFSGTPTAVFQPVTLNVPGTTEFAGAFLQTAFGGEMGDAVKLPNGELTLRGWRPGDRFRAPGTVEPEKLKTLLQDAKIPSWDRANWPIITDGQIIIWTRRFGVAHGFAGSGEDGKALRIWEV